MRLATSHEHIQTHGLRAALERGLGPALGFDHPREVLQDPHLPDNDKRAVLASWASDASAVQDEPTKRWLLGTPEPVSLADILDAMASLDRGPGQFASFMTSSAASARIGPARLRPQAGGPECA